MKRLILEISLKAFHDFSVESVAAVAAKAVRQWGALIDRVENVSILLWTGDGSEILEYKDNPEEEIEWAKWIGIANKPPHFSGHPHLHDRGVLFRSDPPVLNYGHLRALVSGLKTTMRALTGKPVTIGTIFDPGPEFATSPFKYQTHPEIAGGYTMGAGRWVSCAAILKADPAAYAAFPAGIGEGMTLGTFLGGQSRCFLSDMGFDYLWLSNGFGYSLASWSVTGQTFDGTRFDTEAAPQVNQAILGFWRDFRAECPDVPVETRGSNLSTGMDLSSDACPMRNIYRGGFNLVAPPNSPWAALDGDYGLEITGWLSHIAELPETGIFPFRYYIHDPWWLNSPWLDRYGREPHDIYLPLSCGRIDGDGNLQTPSSISLLTLDDTYGQMPDQVPLEVTPHLLQAMANVPDAPGLVTWIYPFDEYHDWTFASPSRASEVFFGDWFIRAAVNEGFPVNTVVSTTNFLTALRNRPHLFDTSILTCPAPDAGTELSDALMRHAEDGGRVLLYGPLRHADTKLLTYLGLSLTDALSGELIFKTSLVPDELTHSAYPAQMRVPPALSGGGVEEVAFSNASTVRAEVSFGAERRVFAALAPFARGGAIGWVRGAFCETIGEKHLPKADDPQQWFHAARLMRWIMAEMGIVLRLVKSNAATGDPVILASRSRNAWFFSGFSRSTSVRLKWRMPEGIAVPVGCDVAFADGLGEMSLSRAWQRECRVFVDQVSGAEISCREQYSGEIGVTRRLRITGLIDATVTFYAHPNYKDEAVRFQKHDAYLGLGAAVSSQSIRPGVLQATGVTGELLISW